MWKGDAQGRESGERIRRANRKEGRRIREIHQADAAVRREIGKEGLSASNLDLVFRLSVSKWACSGGPGC